MEEEEVTYTTVVFLAKNRTTTLENPNELQNFYEEVKEKTAIITPEEVKKAPLCTLLRLLAAGLGITCAILVSVIILLYLQFHTATSEQMRVNRNLTFLNEQLRTQQDHLQRQMQALSRERDGLNWSLEVVLQHDHFPVGQYCKHRVCKPCPENWKLFESHCYLFSVETYWNYWLTWEDGQADCKNRKANLVVIDSPQEQEFINNRTEYYEDEKHGYWIGLNKKDRAEMWTWVDDSKFNLEYWKVQPVTRNLNCALTMPNKSSWQKTSCSMKNRHICEARAFIKH